MKTKKPKTHFEQVPITQIARLLREPASGGDKTKPGKASNVIIQKPSAKTRSYNVRREV